MELFTEFKELLTKEISSAETLCDILKSERDALADNELDLLNELSARKQAEAEGLEQLARKRNDWLAGHGVSSDPNSLKEFISASGDDLEQTWGKLATQLDECQQLNRVNGSIVEQLQRKIRTTLSIIQGQTDDTDLYGRSGKTVSGSAANILTRA